MLNKKVKTLKFLKRTISMILATMVALGSVVMLASLNTTSAYFYSNTLNQTQNLVDVNNIIKPNFYMNAKVNISNNLAKSVDIKLAIPNKKIKPENLILRVFPKAQTKLLKYNDYRLDGATQALHLEVGNDDTQAGRVVSRKVYEVDVYDKKVQGKNLVGKSEFIVFPGVDNWAEPSEGYPLVDGDGKPIFDSAGQQVKMWFPKEKSASWIGEKVVGVINSNRVQFPFDAHSIKVVVFAPKMHPKTVDISKCAYSFYHRGVLTKNGSLLTYDNALWAPDVIDPKMSNGEPVKFEFHFYKDNVLNGNFLFKVVDVTLPIGHNYAPAPAK